MQMRVPEIVLSCYCCAACWLVTPTITAQIFHQQPASARNDEDHPNRIFTGHYSFGLCRDAAKANENGFDATHLFHRFTPISGPSSCPYYDGISVTARCCWPSVFPIKWLCLLCNNRSNKLQVKLSLVTVNEASLYAKQLAASGFAIGPIHLDSFFSRNVVLVPIRVV